VFPSHNFRLAAYGVAALCIASIITFTVSCALQCLPVSYAWLQGNGQTIGKCVNLRALAFTQAVANITLDLIIMILPMPTLYRLHVNWKKKIQIMLMFSFGSIIITVCIIRLRLLVRDFDTDNPTSDFWAVLVWDAAETFTGIICVCLPAVKTLTEQVVKSIAALFSQQFRKPPSSQSSGQRVMQKVPVEKQASTSTSSGVTSVRPATLSASDEV
jgi:hypothetical protein